MKFTNGYWLNRDEYIVNSPLEAFDAMVVETTTTQAMPCVFTQPTTVSTLAVTCWMSVQRR